MLTPLVTLTLTMPFSQKDPRKLGDEPVPKCVMPETYSASHANTAGGNSESLTDASLKGMAVFVKGSLGDASLLKQY